MKEALLAFPIHGGCREPAQGDTVRKLQTQNLNPSPFPQPVFLTTPRVHRPLKEARASILACIVSSRISRKVCKETRSWPSRIKKLALWILTHQGCNRHPSRMVIGSEEYQQCSRTLPDLPTPAHLQSHKERRGAQKKRWLPGAQAPRHQDHGRGDGG